MPIRTASYALLPLGLAAALLSGCGKSNPLSATPASGPGIEQAAVAGTMASTAPVIDDGLMEAADAATFTPEPGALSVDALIRPLHYWRHITDARRSFDFAFSDTDSTGRPTRAVVTVHKVMSGTFNIVFDATPGDSMLFDSVSVVRKPLHDLWERRVLLRRVSSPRLERGEWKVAAISGADSRSFDPTRSTPGSPAFGATHIASVRIQSASADTLITDPLAFFWLKRIPAFGAAEDVKLTVTTAANTDIVVMVRGGMRRRFHNNGDGTYTLLWHTLPEDGLHHLGVNALSRGTLFDDAAPYDSDAWIFPYRVEPSEVAELLP